MISSAVTKQIFIKKQIDDIRGDKPWTRLAPKDKVNMILVHVQVCHQHL